MDKKQAIAIFGNHPTKLARACNITPQAVNDWPDTLPPRIADRVQAALWRAGVSRKVAERRFAELTAA
jgi:hypothetical protein